MKQSVYVVPKMDCPTEEQLIRNRFKSIEEIETLDFDLIARELTVTHNLADSRSLLTTLESLGMRAREKVVGDADTATPEHGISATFRESLAKIRTSFKRELRTYRLLIRDARTPRIAKITLGLAIGYALLPFDLIPDFIPVIGHLDDAIIVPSLIFLAFRFIPREIVEECRAIVEAEMQAAAEYVSSQTLK